MFRCAGKFSAIVFCGALLVDIAYSTPRPAAQQHSSSKANTLPRSVKKYVRDQLLVRFRSGVSRQAMQAQHAQIGATVLQEYRIVENLQLLSLPPGMSVNRAARLYRANPEVLYAEPNYYRYTTQSPLTPNDPLYPDMWNLHNTGQSGGTPGADIHAPEAWGLSTGSSNVVVAVIDTGISYDHQDLAPNVWSSTSGYTVPLSGGSVTCAANTHGLNAITRSCNPLDDNGHGTHVSGTIGAGGNDGTGITGINWHVQVMACKFLDAGGGGYTSNEIACLEYVALMKDSGVNIVATNNSYGGAGFSQAEKDAIDSHRQRGILYVAAAGNAGANNDLVSFYPASYGLPHMISVAATDHKDERAWFSNFGRHSVHLGAPGDYILSTVLHGGYDVYSGTSMAAPHVTGVAALLKAQDEARDWKAIKNLILAGGDPVPAMANTISQRRLNAYGSLACSNTVLEQRLAPRDNDVYLFGGDSLAFEVLNINCGAPNGVLEIPIDGGPETVVLADDGNSPDVEANDGIYAATRQWLASEIGDHTLTFPNHETVTVHVLPPLSPYMYSTSIPFNYRQITGTDLHLRDDDSAVIRPPFPIHFGGVSFPTLNVNSNGNVSAGSFFDWANSPLPASGTPILIAPFWDDLATLDNGTVHWDVIGAAPARELVIEWRNAFAMNCSWSESPYDFATFQVVFFENSSDILFNYSDVILGQYDPFDLFRGCGEEVNGGASATIGIQSMPSLANQFSFMAPSVTNNSSILWQIGQMTPAITQLSPFSVLAGSSSTSLDVKGRSFLPGAVIRWNGADRTTSFVNSGELTASIPASDLASPGTPQITVLNPAPYGGSESAPAPFHIYSSYPVPSLTGIDPNPVPLQVPIDQYYGAGIVVTLTGTDFAPGAVARWNSFGCRTTVLSSTQLRAQIESSVMAAGTAQVTVVNPMPGGGTSAPLTVAVVNPAPLLSDLPRFVGAGAPAFTMNVYGKGFTPSSVLRWNGSNRSTQVIGDLNLSAAIPASDIASLGTAQITVFNPAPGGGSSDPWPISILPPPANDKFANATVIPTYPFTVTESTPGATADAQDPKPPCILWPPDVLESVWFTFTPPAGGGFVSVNTIGSNYGHDLSAWTGSPGNFALLGCTYNPYGDYMLAPLSFSAGSAPVHLMVSTRYMGSTGNLVLKLNVGPGFTLTADPASQTVPRGTNASYTITVTPKFGSFNDRITMSCYVDQPGPQCLFSAPYVTPGGSATPVTLIVSTTNVAAKEVPNQGKRLPALWLTLPIFGLFAMAVGVTKRALRTTVLALFVMLVMLGFLLACGGGNGGSGGGGGGGGGGSQTYTITVVGTSSTVEQQVSTSLVVTF